MRTLFFCDLDNTLMQKVGGDYLISKPTVENITRFIESGNNFIMASGRNCADVRDILKYYGLNPEYVIGNNGACTIKNNEVIASDDIPKEIVKKFIETAIANNYYMTISDGFKVYIEKKYEATRKATHPAFKANTFVENLLDTLETIDRVVTIGFTASKDDTYSKEEKEAIALEISQQFESAYSSDIQILWSAGDHQYFDLVSNTCDKGRAIKHLLKLEEGNFDQVAGMGDALNDIEMLKIVDQAFMMRYGHDTLKKYAIKECDIVCEALNFLMEQEKW